MPYRTDLELIFANPDGTPLLANSISSGVSLLFRRLGLPKGASLHSLRHTHGSHLVADGVPLPVVAERLGTRRFGRRRTFTHTRCAAKMTTRPDVGTIFSVAEPATACQEKSSED
jgi:site-specific recombinase XerD